ncbi:MAG TPA: hypothetical protein VHY08_19715 [Bacillota bacterium]|nr:hypothetical protein [Bacillota bacterium]
MQQGIDSPQTRKAPSLWKVLSGVGILLLAIVALRVYIWQKAVSEQANSLGKERPRFISPAERDRIDKFRGYLNSLSRTDLNSIKQGETYFRRELLSLSPRGKDMAYLVFSDFYYQTSAEYNEKIMSGADLLQARLDVGNSRGLPQASYLKYLNDSTIPKSDPQIQVLMELLFKNGFQLVLMNENYFISERPGYLYDHFGAVLSEALRTFLELRRDDEAADIFSSEGALHFSYRDLGERMIVWERYLDKYPDSLVGDEADYYYHTYLDTMIAGTVNLGNGNTGTANASMGSAGAGIFDERGVLKPEIKRAYYYFKSKYPNTKSGKLIDQFYDLLLHNNFKYFRQVDDFYRQNQIKSGSGE